MGTKTDPGPYDCYAAAEPDEPMFVLLARDPVAPILVELWAKMHAELGYDTKLSKIHEAEFVAEAMRAWSREHPR